MTKHRIEALRVAWCDSLASRPTIARVPGKSESPEEFEKFLLSQAKKALAHMTKIERGALKNNMPIEQYAPIYWAWLRKTAQR